MKTYSVSESERTAWRPNQVVFRALGQSGQWCIVVTEGGSDAHRITELGASKIPTRTAAKMTLAAAVASRAIANMLEVAK